MSITVTEKAADEVRRVWQDQKFDESMFLRIGIAAGGCSGFSYSLKPDNQFDDTSDSKIDCQGVSVVVDKKSALYLEEQQSTGMMDSTVVALHSTIPMSSNPAVVAPHSRPNGPCHRSIKSAGSRMAGPLFLCIFAPLRCETTLPQVHSGRSLGGYW